MKYLDLELGFLGFGTAFLVLGVLFACHHLHLMAALVFCNAAQNFAISFLCTKVKP